MTDIETLTDQERVWLKQLTRTSAKALRIINAQAEALTEARAENDTQRAMVQDTLADLNRKIDLLAEARAEVERLRAVLERRKTYTAEQVQKLATAKALLTIWFHGLARGRVGREQLMRDTRALLSGQPAEPHTRGEFGYCSVCNSTACNQPAAPAWSHATAAQSASELMARVRAAAPDPRDEGSGQ